MFYSFSWGGRAYSFGDGSKGQLGHGEDIQRSKRPELIKVFRSDKIAQVASGECHTAFITDKGALYACGDNRYGKLGLNQRIYNSIVFHPLLVEKFKRLRTENVIKI
jgi:X-linked retinitis pigmentosa GTPase regulator